MKKYQQGYTKCQEKPKEELTEMDRAIRNIKISLAVAFIGALTVLGTIMWSSFSSAQELLRPPTFTEEELRSLNASLDGVYSREERIEDMIRDAATEYGLDPSHAVILAQCESRLDERAANPNSTAKGLYQFTDSTWAHIKAQGHQYDAEENIKQFMIWYPIHPEWWVCE